MADITERFYITGGTLPSHAASYIVRQADKDLLDGLRAGDFCYVLNTRQIGKSSLMVRAAKQLRAEGHRVALLDLTAIGQNVTIEEWYDGLLTLVAEQLHLRDEMEDFWLDHERLGPMQRWMEALRRVALEQRKERLFLFVDEIDCVRSLPFATDELFVGIRECYNRRVQDPDFERLTFCLLGVATPADLIADSRLSPFNIGTRIELRDFTLQEATPLADGLCRTNSRIQNRALLERVLHWTSGHPYLTQRLCRAVASEVGSRESEFGVPLVDLMCRDLFLHPQAQNTDDNLAFVRNCLLRGEAVAPALLDLYGQIHSGSKIRETAANPLHVLLRLSGIVSVARGVLQLRNRIYRRAFDKAWILANMPDGELIRQRKAYKRGVARAATIFGGLAALVTSLLALAVVSARHARSAERNASHLLYIADMNLAQREWEAGNVAHVLELLEETRNSEDRGFEWEYWDRQCHQSLRTLALTGVVTGVAFSPDEARLACLSEHGMLKIWDVESGKERVELQLPPQFCSGLAFSPDGTKLVVGVGSEAQVRDASDGRLLRTLTLAAGQVEGLTYTPDGDFLIAGSDKGEFLVWNAADFQERLKISKKSSGIHSISISDKVYAICTQDGNVQIRDIKSQREIRTIRSDFAAGAIAMSRDGALLAGGERQGGVKVVSAATGATVFHLGTEQKLRAIRFSGDGSRILAAHANGVNSWNAPSGRLLYTFKENLDEIKTFAVSRSERYIVVGSVDGRVKVWDLRTVGIPRTLHVSAKSLWNVQFSPDGKRLVTSGTDGDATFWDVRSGIRLRTIHVGSRRITPAVYSHDGAFVLTGDTAGNAKLWDAATGNLVRSFVGHTSAINAASFSPDDRTLYTASDDKSTIEWNVADGRIVERFAGHAKPVESLALSSDGLRLLTAGDDAKSILWNVRTGKSVRTFPSPAEVWGVAFSPDGNRVATANLRSTAQVWDVNSGRLLTTLKGHTGWLIGVTFSPDGRRILTSSRDGTAKLWEAQSGRELLTLRGHQRQVSGVAFSPDGHKIATVGQDGDVRIWDTTPADAP